MTPPSRRAFHRAALGLLAAGPAFAQDRPRATPPPRPAPPTRKLAVVTTAYYYLSHAYHVCGRFLDGYLRADGYHYPDWGIAGMYVAQQKAGDLSRELAAKHGFRLAATPAEALTLGGDKLAVDGVLLIGEHGDYPYNAKGQKLYPRYELFQEIAAVCRRAGKAVPVFCDKHLSYSFAQAQAMAAAAKELGMPLMAGSSLPITWRRPELELPIGAQIKDALVVSRGELEIFGIHALEALQCMVERRAPAVQGVKAVTGLEGDAVWKAGDAGVWSWELLEHALARSDSLNVGDVRANCRHYVPSSAGGNRALYKSPVAFVVEYADGLRATVLILNGHVDDTTFAARIEGQPRPAATLFYLPPPPGARFLEALTMKIEDFLATGRPPYPVERTLLTGGILDFVLDSLAQGQQRRPTPELAGIAYAPPADSGFLRGEWKQPVRR